MEREPRQREAEALDRYWDAVVSGHMNGVPADVDEAPAALIRTLQALGTAPGQEAARARIWDGLTQQPRYSRKVLAGEMPGFPPRGPSANGSRNTLRRHPAGSAISRWLAAQAATAALLILTLAAHGQDRGLRR